MPAVDKEKHSSHAYAEKDLIGSFELHEVVISMLHNLFRQNA